MQPSSRRDPAEFATHVRLHIFLHGFGGQTPVASIIQRFVVGEGAGDRHRRTAFVRPSVCQTIECVVHSIACIQWFMHISERRE